MRADPWPEAPTRPPDALETEPSKPAVAPVERLALRLDELAAALGVSRRAIERERSAGRFPPPDLHIGKMPLWRPSTLSAWIDEQAKGPGVRR